MSDLYANFARFYQLWAARLGPDEVEFYRERALQVDGPVLELAVGTGRVAIPIARAGKPVVGVDVSPAMLGVARAEAERAGVADKLTLIEADIRSHILEEPVDIAYIPGHSFQHMLTIDDQLAALRAAHGSLRSGGRLLLSVFIPDPTVIMRKDGEREQVGEFVDDSGRRCELWAEHHYRIVAQELDMTAVFVAYEGGDVVERTEAPLTLHMFVPYEMRHLLARAGFEIESEYGWFDERPLTEESRESIWVARKP